MGPSETPLTLAAQLADPVEVIKALRNGGAHLDFRAKDGMTALHRAARARNQVALKVPSEPTLHGHAPSPSCPPGLTTATPGDPGSFHLELGSAVGSPTPSAGCSCF